MSFSAGEVATSFKPRSQGKTRTRAPKACLSCRSRKVRCDVFRRGPPCMNCYLDNETCVVTARASRSRLRCENGEDTLGSRPPYPHLNNGGEYSAENVVKARLHGLPIPEAPTRDTNSPAMCALQQPDSMASLEPDIPTTPSKEDSGSHHSDTTIGDRGSEIPQELPACTYASASSKALSSLQAQNSWSADFCPDTTSDVVYSYYPFLTLGNLSNIPPQDVNFLEAQGCLRVPTRSLLDEVLQQYFLHVHPLLPLLDEGEFWDIYCHKARSSSHSGRISLLLLQSMLFAACSFVSKTTIKALGYPSIRAARAALYRRAKLLYNLESESSQLILSQSALLLSYWSPSSSRKINTAWLSLAIQNAKSAEAHHYAAMLSVQPVPDPLQDRKQKTLKRLWWCCIIRDRTLGLLMRRPIHITRSHFDFDANPMLSLSDLEDEFARSKVYQHDVKRCLAEVLIQLTELCVILTGILTVVCPLDDTPGWSRGSQPRDAEQLRACKMDLRRWYKAATLEVPTFGNWPHHRLLSDSNKVLRHDSVILYTNLVFMYYHSTRVTICHHEVMQLASQRAELNGIGSRPLVNFAESKHELQDAASGVTECLKELVHRNLARWLPTSAVVCTALPLVLNILDVKLSTPSSTSTLESSTPTQHRLNILVEAMRIYQPQYDGVDWVSEIIRHIVNLPQLDRTHLQAEIRPKVSNWVDILALQPSLYLRLAFALDMSLSKGRLPDDGDFPASLRGLFTDGFTSTGSVIQASQPRSQSASASSTDKATPSMPPSHSQCCCSRGAPETQFATALSDADGSSNELRPDHLRTYIRMDQLVPNATLTLFDDLFGLQPDLNGVLDTLKDAESPDSSRCSAGQQLDRPMSDVPVHENGEVWNEFGVVEDNAERDTARALLEALEHNDREDC